MCLEHCYHCIIIIRTHAISIMIKRINNHCFLLRFCFFVFSSECLMDTSFRTYAISTELNITK